MFFELFKKRVKVMKVKRKAKPKIRPKATAKVKARKPKTKKAAVSLAVMPKVIGKVTHYFPRVKAAVVLIKSGNLSAGDKIQIKGHTTNFKQKVASLQINNMPIEEAKARQEVGIAVKSRVRHNDVVYKL